jgi:hypothetical protein
MTSEPKKNSIDWSRFLSSLKEKERASCFDQNGRLMVDGVMRLVEKDLAAYKAVRDREAERRASLQRDVSGALEGAYKRLTRDLREGVKLDDLIFAVHMALGTHPAERIATEEAIRAAVNEHPNLFQKTGNKGGIFWTNDPGEARKAKAAYHAAIKTRLKGRGLDPSAKRQR